MKRRKFIRQVGLAGAGIMSNQSISEFNPSGFFPSFQFSSDPTDVQKSWMDLKFGMFIHFGINTYYDKEWSDGNLDPYHVNPVRLGTDEWCRVARDAGMKYIILVTKHHDGFCLWPSAHSDYTITRSEYNRDIVAALVNSAEKYGLKVGFYYSLWDQHMEQHIGDDWEFLDFMIYQLEELLTGYGPILQIWLDGFWRRQQSGWTKLPEMVEGTEPDLEVIKDRNENFIDSWRMEGAYRWQMDHMYNFIKSLQPECLILNNSTGSYPGVPLFPVDVRSGERYTDLQYDRKIWNWMGKDVYVPLQIETTLSTKGNQRFPEGNWFWHDWDHSVLSVEQIRSYRTKAREMEANLILNAGPDPDGELRPEDVRVLTELNE